MSETIVNSPLYLEHTSSFAGGAFSRLLSKVEELNPAVGEQNVSLFPIKGLKLSFKPLQSITENAGKFVCTINALEENADYSLNQPIQLSITINKTFQEILDASESLAAYKNVDWRQFKNFILMLQGYGLDVVYKDPKDGLFKPFLLRSRMPNTTSGATFPSPTPNDYYAPFRLLAKLIEENKDTDSTYAANDQWPVYIRPFFDADSYTENSVLKETVVFDTNYENDQHIQYTSAFFLTKGDSDEEKVWGPIVFHKTEKPDGMDAPPPSEEDGEPIAM